MKKKTERVVVDTPIKVGDAVKNQELPFKLLVLAPISGKRKPAVKTPRVVTTTGNTSLDRVLADTTPELRVEVENKLSGLPQRQDGDAPPTMQLNLAVRRMEDFTPAGIERALAESVTAFREKLAILNKLTNFQAKLMNSKDLEGLGEELDDAGLRDVLAQAGADRKGSL